MIASKSTNKDYCFIIQQFDTPLFAIRYYCFYCGKKDVLTITVHEATPTFRIGVNNTHEVTSKGLGKQVFHQGHYNCFFEPRLSFQYSIGPLEENIFLDILLKKDYQLYVQYCFPETEGFFEKVSNGVAARLTPRKLVQNRAIYISALNPGYKICPRNSFGYSVRIL